MNGPERKVENGIIDKCRKSEKSEEKRDDGEPNTFKALDESLGELYISLNYLNRLEKTQPRVPAYLPEEAEYHELDKSLEDLDDGDGKADAKPCDKGRESSQSDEKPARMLRKKNREDLGPGNREAMRLSLKVNGGNRPGTPTFRGTSSNYSDADSGIGTSTPTKRISDLVGAHFMRMNSDNDDDSLASPRILRGTPTRSRRMYNYEPDYSQRKTASLRSNASLNIDRYLNRLTPNSELRISNATSMRSLTIPMGSTDGRKIIKRSETSPEELLNLSAK